MEPMGTEHLGSQHSSVLGAHFFLGRGVGLGFRV